jgi:hypothetical protein
MNVNTTNTKAINLSTSEKHIYNKVVGHNKDGNSINKDIAMLLATGKGGVESVERIAIALKAVNEPLNAYKQAVYRFYKDLPKGERLSLQNTGKKGTPAIVAPSNSGKNSKKAKVVTTNIDTIKTFINKMTDSDKAEFTFDLVDELSSVDKKGLIEYLQSTIKKVA